MRGTRTLWLGAALIGLGCARAPDDGRGMPAPTSIGTAAGTDADTGTDAGTDAGMDMGTDAGTDAAADPGAVIGGRGTPWQERCAAWLEGGLRVAAEKEPGLRGAWVDREPPVQVDGATREAVVIAVFPPVFHVPGMHIRVERTVPPRSDGASPPEWQRFAESFHGSYHATIMKRAGGIDAAFSFDGWESARVDVLAPIFQAAADHCAAP